MFLFFALIALSSVLTYKVTPKRTSESEAQTFPAQLIPYPVLPLPNITLPSLAGKYFVVVGCRGIALQVVLQAHALGATVICTTRDKTTFDYTTVPSDVDVRELEYGKDKSVQRFVTKYMNKYGRIPDYVDDCGLTVYNGDQIAFTEDELIYQAQMYIIGSLLLEQGFMSFNNLSIPVVWNYALSTAGKGVPPVFQEFYNVGKVFKIKHIEGNNANKKYPNVRMTGVACVFANTTISATSYNPSALMGDLAQIEFQYLTIALAGIIGVPPSVVALAHLQAMLVPGLLGNEPIFQVPSLGGTSSDSLFYMDVWYPALQYQSNFTVYVQDVFGINITQH